MSWSAGIGLLGNTVGKWVYNGAEFFDAERDGGKEKTGLKGQREEERPEEVRRQTRYSEVSEMCTFVTTSLIC